MRQPECTRTSVGRSVVHPPLDQRNVRDVVDLVFERDGVEFAEDRRQPRARHALDKRFPAHAVFDQALTVTILSLCVLANFVSSGTRAIVPSSFMISQMTPAG